jgi:hypothetical protein
LRDPWSDLVNWYQEAMLTGTKYRVFTGAMNKFATYRFSSSRADALPATPGAEVTSRA